MKLNFIKIVKYFLNAVLRLFERILFSRKIESPRKIVVFKVGNIGDILCAIPSFIAIRKNYPEAEITLLTSPGERGVPGAKELLQGAWYFNRMIIYGSDEINSFQKLKKFISDLRRERFDLFIQIPPHEWTNFRTFVRNIIFAKLLGVESAFGFRIRVIINLFRKTQIDYVDGEKETESLLRLLRENGVKADKTEFDLPISAEAESKIEALLSRKWPDFENELLVAIHSGTKKNFPEKRWFPERFGEVVRYLEVKYAAKIIVAGSEDDRPDAEIISRELSPENALITAGQLTVLETAALLKHCGFVLGIDSGLLHLAAAVGKPTVGLYSILDIFGDWFPYGDSHIPVYHRFLDCNYRQSECIKKSMGMISVSEVKAACDAMVSKLTYGK